MFSLINLAIAAFILAFAFLIKHVFSDSLEEDNAFVWLVASFMLAYLVAALAMSFLNPLQEIEPLMAAQQTQEEPEPVVKL
jgi:type IV secretory pathway component VirB8